MPSSACSSGCSGDEAELRCLGDRLVHSSRPLEAAAVAELHVALAFRGCGREGNIVKTYTSHYNSEPQTQVLLPSQVPGYDTGTGNIPVIPTHKMDPRVPHRT